MIWLVLSGVVVGCLCAAAVLLAVGVVQPGGRYEGRHRRG